MNFQEKFLALNKGSVLLSNPCCVPLRSDYNEVMSSQNNPSTVLESLLRGTLKVHREGKGVCGVYPKDIASTKVEMVCGFAKQHQHPLQCVMEET